MTYRVFIRVNNNWQGATDYKQVTIEKDEVQAESYKEAVEKVLDQLEETK